MFLLALHFRSLPWAALPRGSRGMGDFNPGVLEEHPVYQQLRPTSPPLAWLVPQHCPSILATVLQTG